MSVSHTPTSTAPQFRLVTSNNPNSELVALKNALDSSYARFPNIISQVIDLDGDGQYEVLIGSDSTREVYYLDRNASGQWVKSDSFVDSNSSKIFGPSTLYTFPQMIEINGSLNLLVTSNNHPIYYYIKNSAGQWVKQTDENNPFSDFDSSSYNGDAPRFVDLDGDGDLDMTISTSGSDNTVHYYIQEAPDRWIKSNNLLLPSLPSRHGVRAEFGDLDNDGDLDFVSNLDYSLQNNNSWMQQTGVANSLFRGLNTYYNASNPEIVDLDGDGDLDVIFVGSRRDNLIQENLLYSPDDAVKVIRHASKQIDMADAQSNTVNLDDYFSNTETGDLTYTITDRPDFATLTGNIITLRSNDSDDLGVHSLQVTASNGTFSTKQAININVTNVGNDAPVFIGTNGLRYDTQDSWVVDLNKSFSDPDGDDLSFEVTGLPVFATYTVNGEDNMITFITNNTATGLYSANITATDSLGASATLPYIFQIAEINDAPSPLPLPQEYTLLEGVANTQYLPSLFHDEEGNPFTVSYEVRNPTDGFSHDGSLFPGLVSFTADREIDEPIYVVVTATETTATAPRSGEVILTFTVSGQNDRPTVTSPNFNIGVTEDSAFSFNIDQLGFNDEEDGTDLTFSYADFPTGFTASNGIISANRYATDHDAFGDDGTALITITAADSSNSQTSSVLTLTLNHVNDTPTAQTTRITRTLDQNTLLSFNIQDEFGFADEEAESLELSLSGTTHFAISADGEELETYNKEKTLGNDLVGTHTFTLSARDSGKSTPSGTATADIKSVTGTVVLEIVNVNDAPELRPADVRPTYKLGAYINEQIIIDFREYFEDIDFIHSEAGEALTFTLTAGNEKTRAFFQTIDGLEKPDVNDPNADQNIFTLTDKMLAAGDNAFLTLSPNDATTGELLFSVKAQDKSDAFSDSLNFQLDVKNAYLWERGNEKLNITATNQDADARSEITATIGDDDTFSHFTWERSGDSLTIRLVLGEGEQQTSETVATINNIFSTRGPESVAVRKGDQNIALLYLNTGENLDNSVEAFSVNTSDIDPVSYTEIILPYQTGSDAVIVTHPNPDPDLVDSANVQYHIYGSDGSTSNTDRLTGGNGDDFFYVGSGNHIFYGQGGSDTVVYENPIGAIIINLGTDPEGTQTITDSNNDSTIYNDELSSIENVKIIGGAGKTHTITGTNQANRLEGGDGGDTIDGKGGADQLIGGGGKDYIIVTGSETLVDGGESYGDNNKEHRDVLSFASDDTVTNVEVDYLLDAGGKFINFEEMDLAADGKNFIVKLDKDSIMEIFGGNVTVSGRTNDGTKDTIILKDFADWTRTEEDGIIKYTYGTEATITMQDDNVNVIELPTPVTHTINIDSKDNPDTSHSDFKFVDNDDAAQVVLDFNPLRGDVLLFKDADTVSPLQIKEELPQFLNSWWFISGQGLRLNSGNFGTSEASDIFIQPAEGADISGIAPRFPGTPLNTDAWNDLVEALGGADAFEFM